VALIKETFAPPIVESLRTIGFGFHTTRVVLRHLLVHLAKTESRSFSQLSTEVALVFGVDAGAGVLLDELRMRAIRQQKLDDGRQSRYLDLPAENYR
jgi:hypothetical protein